LQQTGGLRSGAAAAKFHRAAKLEVFALDRACLAQLVARL